MRHIRAVLPIAFENIQKRYDECEFSGVERNRNRREYRSINERYQHQQQLGLSNFLDGRSMNFCPHTPFLRIGRMALDPVRDTQHESAETRRQRATQLFSGGSSGGDRTATRRTYKYHLRQATANELRHSSTRHGRCRVAAAIRERSRGVM
jgi:hypothetical protein